MRWRSCRFAVCKAGAIALVLACAACGPRAAEQLELSPGGQYQADRCFGLGRKIAYVADRSSQSGDDLWFPPHLVFAFPFSFDFTASARDAEAITYAVAHFEEARRTLFIRLFSNKGRLIQESPIYPAAIRMCSADETVIEFLRSVSGDGINVHGRVVVKISRMNGLLNAKTDINETSWLVIFPRKRARTYQAEYRLID